MLNSVAALLLTLTAPATLSLAASPAAYDNAVAHEAYQITVYSQSSSAMEVRATLAPDNACSVDLSRTPSWAAMSGPSSFVLAPHAHKTFLVHVGQPPPGHSELIAAFLASDPSKNGVHTTAGVGTALRFSEPGKTVLPPCPKPKPTTNPKVRTIVVGSGQTSSATGALEIALGVVVGLFILAIIAAFLYTRRSRRSTR